MRDRSKLLKVVHVVPYYFPAHCYGGPVASVYGLCRAVARAGADVRVLTTDTNGAGDLAVDTSSETELEDGVRVRYCHRVARMSVSPTLVRELGNYLRWADVVHLTAVYSFPTIPTLAMASALKRPVVWSPRGSLQRWERTRRVAAKYVWEKACRLIAPEHTVLHTTSEEEAVSSETRMRLRTEIIRNGVFIPEPKRRPAQSGEIRLLYVGRLDPQKGIERLLEACRLVSERGLSWSLKIVGDGKPGYTALLSKTIADMGLTARIEMAGHLTGTAKEDAFATSDVLVLPSFRENFGMVVAEALAREVPVIAAKGTPWQKVESVGCGLWVDNDAGSLVEAIAAMARMPLREMGRRGRDWMCSEFSWDSVGEEMLALYREIGNGRAS